MILFDNPEEDLEELIKDAMIKVVCRKCRAKSCIGDDGQCDLVNPILLEVHRIPEGEMSCRGCKDNMADLCALRDNNCYVCARWYDDPEHYQDYYEEG